jgi:NAD(P)-dependent dehydrogenase (short-subunit alcohol dehydrogenase family)
MTEEREATAGDAPGRVLVTGAGRGIGLALARGYAAAGWRVVGACRRPDRAEALAGLGEGVELVALDVTVPASIAAAAARVEGAVDVLVNNAGVFGGNASLAAVGQDDLLDVFRVNAAGPVLVTQAFLPHLRRGRGRRVVSISTGLAGIADNRSGGYLAYRASKAALNMLVRTMAHELDREGIIAVAIDPGWVRTDMGGSSAPTAPDEAARRLIATIARLRPGDSGAFLAADGRTRPW